MARKTWTDISAYMIKEQSGWESERGLGKVFLGRIVLSVPQGSVETNREAFEPYATNYWPGLASGTTGDPCIDEYVMEREHPGRPGYSRITLIYRKPKLLGQLDTALKCILYVDISGVATRITRKNNGTDDTSVWQTVEGLHCDPTTGDDYITEFRVISGSNEVLKPTMNIKLTVAYTTVPFHTLYDTVGKYHTGQATFGGAFTASPIAAKHLLYIGSKISTDTNRHGKWLANHYFTTSDTAYDEMVVTQAYIKRALEVALKKLGGDGFEAAAGQKSRIIAWEPTGDAITVDIHRGGADFSAADGILYGLTYLNVS